MLPAQSKFKISSVIRDLLLADEWIREAVSGKVYPLYADENTKGDFILYMRDEYSIDYTKIGESGHKCRVFVNIVSDNYDRGLDITERVYKTLQGDYKDGMKIRMIDSTEDATDKKYIQVLLFAIE